MKSWIHKAVTQWKEEGLELNPGVSFADIENIENQIGYNFPNDFKELYSIVNGFADFEMRGFMLSLWSLERVVNNYKDTGGLIMFSDFSISVCQYGFDRNKEGVFKAYTHFQKGPIKAIAESFRQMIEFINCDSELLF